MPHRNEIHSPPCHRLGRLTVALLSTALLSTALVPAAMAAPAKGEIQPANPENPWDYVGRLHNEGLDRMGEEIASRGEDPNPAQVMFMAWKGALATSAPIGAVDMEALPFDSLADVVARKDTTYPMLDEAQQSYLERLAEVAQSEDGPQEKIEAFIILELEAEARLGAKKATPILAAAAVGRYSTAYWLGQDSDGSAWNLYPSTGSFDDAIASPNRHIEADIRGAVLGFVAGPEGMIVAGIITSGYSLLGALWDWLF